MSSRLLFLSALISCAGVASGYVCYRPVRKICTNSNNDSAIGVFWLEVNGTKSNIGVISQAFPLESMRLRYTTADYDSAVHNAPRKQFIVNLDAPHEVLTTDGAFNIFSAGELFYVDDLTGPGHYSRAHNHLPRHSMFLAVDPAYDAGTCINASLPTGASQCP
eukprot:Hpha_TRINITY_DN15918_c1_g3::TRINITY_DN15918_c1_g3_i1::g.72135::m.72135